ncbi:hypothetical protein [Paracoccus sp. (in: a-proteobacteria)]|uniref:hypothetical protein n=1 Tax=Paracoccus sp. TaxID=267 RepID=UPI0035B025D2
MKQTICRQATGQGGLPRPNLVPIKVSEIASHWRLHSDTVRRILLEAGARPAAASPAMYCWWDIWAIEGCRPLPGEIEAFQRRLLTPAELRAEYYPFLQARAIRTRSQLGSISAVKLGTEWRYRGCDIRREKRHG